MAEKKSSKKTSKKASKKSAARRKADEGYEPGGEFASPSEVKTGLIRGNSFGIKAVQYSVVDGDAVFEGDIELGSIEQMQQRSAELAGELRGDMPFGVVIPGDQFHWPDCRVPFTIDAGIPNEARIDDAIAHWETNTNYRFVERTAANAAQFPDWVTFRRHATRCSSWVGRQGGQQIINLSDGCPTGSVIHEIGHAIGLWHEQSREDRDAFITINWDKITPGTEHNFNQHITDGDDFGPYDYGSIMHYPRTAFSIDGSETITPVDPAAVIGQRTGLSPGDIAAANSLCTPPKLAIETLKEHTKELITETRKELIAETVKELSPETLKERFPETRKEQFPETIKEHFPETAKEFIEPTRVETVQPGGPITTQPGLGGIGGTIGSTVGGLGIGGFGGAVGSQIPFAMRTPQRAGTAGAQAHGHGQAPGHSHSHSHGNDEYIDQLLAQMAMVVDALQANEGDRETLVAQYQELAAALQQFGWQ